MASDKKITIYTDGACSGNPGPGGWGAWLTYNGHEKELYGGEPETTNNRMELTAAIKALEALKGPSTAIIYTDSVYVRDGITSWIHNWKRNGWKNAKKQPVKNDDLWRQLDALMAIHNVELQWVKGHAGIPGNEKADELANKGMDAHR